MKRWLVLLGLTATALAQPQHPLDPLSQSEMEAMVGILRDSGKLTESSRFPIITLHEPSKAVVRAFKAGDPIERRAFAVILDRAQNKTYEAVIDLNNRKLSRWTPLPGKQAGVLIEEFVKALLASFWEDVYRLACSDSEEYGRMTRAYANMVLSVYRSPAESRRWSGLMTAFVVNPSLMYMWRDSSNAYQRALESETYQSDSLMIARREGGQWAGQVVAV